MMKKHTLAAAFAALFAVAGAATAGSNVIGSVDTNVRVYGATQSQSGLLNKQDAAFGSVSDSTVVGAVDTDVTIRRAYQRQSGLLNKQELNAGSVNTSSGKKSRSGFVDTNSGLA